MNRIINISSLSSTSHLNQKKSSFANVSQAKQKKSIKIRNFIVIQNWIKFLKNERLVRAFVNFEIKINFINQVFVIQWKMQSINEIILSLSSFLNEQNRYCHETHEFIYNIINSWNQHRQCKTLFYAIDYIESNFILNMFMLIVENILVNSTKNNWRFKIKFKKFQIDTSKQFAKNLENHEQIFALMCAEIEKQSKKQKFKITKMSKQLKNLKSQFDDIKTDILFELNKSNHAIDLKKNEKSSFMSLYNLSQNELAKLRRYIENALIKKWIKYSIFFVDASILFVSKKNENFRFCVNYRNLNAMIIKNRHSLFLITKTLNRFSDVKKFIKIDLKNVYHRIRIKQNDEWKTTFRTRYEHFEYQIMLFELINVSTIF